MPCPLTEKSIEASVSEQALRADLILFRALNL
jgi:hypothetical protein